MDSDPREAKVDPVLAAIDAMLTPEDREALQQDDLYDDDGLPA